MCLPSNSCGTKNKHNVKLELGPGIQVATKKKKKQLFKDLHESVEGNVRDMEPGLQELHLCARQ